MFAYPIEIERDDDGTYLVTCPDLPEVTTFGEDRDDGLCRAVDAIEEAIAARIADRAGIPQPSEGQIKVALPTLSQLKIRLYQVMCEKGVNKSQLARTLHWHRPQVDRLLNLRHATRLDHVDSAFHALGAKVSVDVSAEDNG